MKREQVKSAQYPMLLHAFDGYEVMRSKDGSLYLRKGAEYICGVTSVADAKKLFNPLKLNT